MTALSVVLATRNNRRVLGETLKALCRLQTPGAGWKLIVVDNGSSDDSAQVIRSFAGRLPIVLAEEPRAGKNRALNRALPFLEGELVVFTDDDVLPDEDWLCRLWDAAQAQPEFAMFGGTIRPSWPGPMEILPLVERKLAVLYTVTDPAQTEGPIEPDLIWGPNMAVRRAIFEAGYRFDESIGPNGTMDYAMGSETSFTRRLGKAGFRAFFVSQACVQHVVRPHQLERSWILGRACRFGRGHFRAEAEREQQTPFGGMPPRVFGYPRWIVRRLLGLALRRLTTRCRRDRTQIFEADWDFYFWLGCALESRRAVGPNVERSSFRSDGTEMNSVPQTS